MSAGSHITVFLSQCSEAQAPLRDELALVFERAGIKVLNDNDSSKLTENTKLDLSTANCSVHILFPEYEPVLQGGSGISLARYQFLEAQKQTKLNPNFRIFVWIPPSTNLNNIEPKQLDFINEVRNNIVGNMVFSNAGLPMQLADDLRSQMEINEVQEYSLRNTDIFLISNQLDELQSNEISEMLSDIVPVEKLNIIQDSDIDYSELCKQQVPKSKLAVIYFKNSGDWALPFAQQLWRNIGGATTHTPILLIGDTDPEENIGRKFIVPKVISLIIDGELIPLEIKVQYDKTVSPDA